MASSAVARERFRRRVARGALPELRGQAAPLDVWSFAGHKQLLEQIASIRSFVAAVGSPDRFVVHSDGSLTRADEELLRRVHPAVEVMQTAEIVAGAPPSVRRYAVAHALGIKLALLMRLPADRVTLYLDSDVLLYRAASELRVGVRDGHWALVDCAPAFDEQLLTLEDRRVPPMNSGAMLVQGPIAWTDAVARLDDVDEPMFWAEQTVVHLAFSASGWTPFPSDRYVVSRRDEFRLRTAHRPRTLALRHYVAPVRYRLWTSLPREVM